MYLALGLHMPLSACNASGRPEPMSIFSVWIWGFACGWPAPDMSAGSAQLALGHEGLQIDQVFRMIYDARCL